MLTLAIEKRAKGEKAEKLRKQGKLPAVYYGRKEVSTPITISKIEFTKIWKQAGESSIITLKSAHEEHDALIKDVDFDPVTGTFRHADFYVVEKGKKLEVSVPLTFIGVAPAVKDLGGILVKVIHQLKIEAIPKDLPHGIEVDVSSLVTFESQILAKDLKLPEGVSLVINPEDVVASVAKPVEEKEEEVPVDLSTIEISEKKGKEEKEGEEGEAGAGGAGGAPKAGDKETKEVKKETKS